MTPRRVSACACATRSARARASPGATPPRPCDLVEAHLHGDLEPPAQLARRAVERAHHLGAVERLDDVGVVGHRGGLVALQLADEVNRDPVAVGQLGALGRRLLVAVLTDRGHAQLSEQVDVGGREELRDDDEGELDGRGRRPRPPAGCGPAPRRGGWPARHAGMPWPSPRSRRPPSRRHPRTGRCGRRDGRSRGRRAHGSSRAPSGPRRHRHAAGRRPRRATSMAGVPVHDTVALTGCDPRRGVAHLGGHLVAAATDRRADDGIDLAGPELAHHRQGPRHDARDETRPAGVHGGDHPTAPESSTGTQSATSTARATSVDRVTTRVAAGRRRRARRRRRRPRRRGTGPCRRPAGRAVR